MNKYEAMFMIKPDLSEDEKKNLFEHLKDIVVKNNGNVLDGNIWQEKRKLYFRIKKYQEAIYYLMRFDIAPLSVSQISHAYKLNENILRVLITRLS